MTITCKPTTKRRQKDDSTEALEFMGRAGFDVAIFGPHPRFIHSWRSRTVLFLPGPHMMTRMATARRLFQNEKPYKSEKTMGMLVGETSRGWNTTEMGQPDLLVTHLITNDGQQGRLTHNRKGGRSKLSASSTGTRALQPTHQCAIFPKFGPQRAVGGNDPVLCGAHRDSSVYSIDCSPARRSTTSTRRSQRPSQLAPIIINHYHHGGGQRHNKKATTLLPRTTQCQSVGWVGWFGWSTSKRAAMTVVRFRVHSSSRERNDDTRRAEEKKT
jgi:hypothetical protein